MSTPLPGAERLFDSKILVGIDFTDHAEIARTHALDVARHTGSALVLAHALEAGGPPRSWLGRGPGPDDDHARACMHLAATAETCRGAGVPTEYVCIHERPDAGLAAVAADFGVSLCVLGTHDRTGVKRWLMGSVAERMVRLADADVLIARAPMPAGGYRRILTATDFSAAAERAMARAASLLAPDGELLVLHSWYVAPATSATGDTVPMAGALAAEVRDEVTRQGAQLLEAWRPRVPRIRFQTLGDTPAHGIERVLDDGEFDLVTLGSHGRRGLRRLLLGSVAERVTRHAPCSVYVAHDDEAS